MICDICTREKDTITVHHLHVVIFENEEKNEWNVCETCQSAFRVIEEYIQG